MNPSAKVEHIPQDWARVDVALYHAYLRECNLRQANFIVYAGSQDALLTTGESEYVEILKKPCHNGNDLERDKIIREHLATIEIPEAIRLTGPYSIKVECYAASGNWKSGWAWEGCGVTKADD